MKNFFEKNKGVIVFYLAIAIIASGCSYRLSRLNQNTDKNVNYTIAESGMVYNA